MANFCKDRFVNSRVTRLLVTVGVFCKKTASKCTQTYHSGDNIFFWGWAQPPKSHPTPSTPRPSLLKS